MTTLSFMPSQSSMPKLYHDLIAAKRENKKLLAILLDPDKINWSRMRNLLDAIKDSPATHIFVGGSIVSSTNLGQLITVLKNSVSLPIVLFPGDPSQISPLADGILLLSLISGRNPDYLIGHHVTAAVKLRQSELEILSTGYILVGSDATTAVSRVSRTAPIENPEQILSTAIASEMLGHKLLYLEAGSGAKDMVGAEVIRQVASAIEIPLIVGGGIRETAQIMTAYNAGADLVVIGTAFEQDLYFFKK
jgi:phosphoglycerol geranylgeranyltransferase